jgi:hypothetical protein
VQITIDSTEPLSKVPPSAGRWACGAAVVGGRGLGAGWRVRAEFDSVERADDLEPPDPAAVRNWAKDNGHAISDRGRVPAAIVKAYIAAGNLAK